MYTDAVTSEAAGILLAEDGQIAGFRCRSGCADCYQPRELGKTNVTIVIGVLDLHTFVRSLSEWLTRLFVRSTCVKLKCTGAVFANSF